MKYRLTVEFEDPGDPKYDLEELRDEIWRVIEGELLLKITSFSLEGPTGEAHHAVS